jgi:hypothetical protein
MKFTIALPIVLAAAKNAAAYSEPEAWGYYEYEPEPEPYGKSGKGSKGGRYGGKSGKGSKNGYYHEPEPEPKLYWPEQEPWWRWEQYEELKPEPTYWPEPESY